MIRHVHISNLWNLFFLYQITIYKYNFAGDINDKVDFSSDTTLSDFQSIEDCSTLLQDINDCLTTLTWSKTKISFYFSTFVSG